MSNYHATNHPPYVFSIVFYVNILSLEHKERDSAASRERLNSSTGESISRVEWLCVIVNSFGIHSEFIQPRSTGTPHTSIYGSYIDRIENRISCALSRQSDRVSISFFRRLFDAWNAFLLRSIAYSISSLILFKLLCLKYKRRHATARARNARYFRAADLAFCSHNCLWSLCLCMKPYNSLHARGDVRYASRYKNSPCT